MTRRSCTALLVTAVLAGCGDGRGGGVAGTPAVGDAPRGAERSPTVAERPGTRTPLPGEPVVTVTEQHDGARLPAVAGAVLVVRLDDDRVWTPLTARGPAEVVPVEHESAPDAAVWEVRLAAPGQVLLTSRGEPACSRCPPSLDLDVVLDVRSR